MHLYCLEKFTDFIRVCRDLNIEADTRDLPFEARGRNPFRLSTAAEEKCVRGFIRTCQARGVPDGYPLFGMPGRPHEGTLTHRLACVKLKREPSGVGKQRSLREQQAGYKGCTLDVHVGDLEVERRVRGWTRRHGNQNQLVVRPRVPRKYRGVGLVRRGEEEEEDEDAEGEVEDERGEEEGEPAWVAAAREPVFECHPQKRSRGKKGRSDGALDDRTAAEKAESSSDDDDDSSEDEHEDEDDADALEQQKQELELKLTELKRKQRNKAGKRAKTEVENEDDDDDDVVVPSRKRVRK